MVNFGTLLLREKPAALLQKTVDLRIPVGDKIKLPLGSFRRMKNIENIRIARQLPSQKHCVEFPLIDEFLEKRPPLHDPYLHTNPDVSQTFLDNLAGSFSFIAAMVG